MLTAKDIAGRIDWMRAERVRFDDDWELVAEYINPTRAKYFSKTLESDDLDQEWKYTADGERYAATLAATFASMTFPKGGPFFDVDVPTLRMSDQTEERRWCQELGEALYDTVAHSESGFFDHIPEVLRDAFDFGVGVLYEEDDTGFGDLRYRRWGLHTVYLSADHRSEHDAIAHKYELTARAALDEFGDALPEQVVEKAARSPHEKCEFYHFIVRMGRKKWGHYHLTTEAYGVGGPRILRYKQSTSAQVYVLRYETDSDSAYSYGLGFRALTDLKRLNDAEGDRHEMSDRLVHPPLLVGNEDHLKMSYLQPRQIVYSNFNQSGRPEIAPLQTANNPIFLLEDVKDRTQKIAERYLYDIFRVAREKGVSATQFTELREMHDDTLGPIFQKVISQLGDPILRSALDQLTRAENYWSGTMPQSIMDQGGFDALAFKWTSPMAGAAKVKKGMALQRTIEAVANFASMKGDPSAFDKIDEDKLVNHMFDAFNAPLDVLRTDDEVEELRQSRAQAQEQAQQLEAAPGMAQAMKNVSEIGAEQ